MYFYIKIVITALFFFRVSDFKAFIKAEIFADKQVPPIPQNLTLPMLQIAMQLNFCLIFLF